MKINSATKELFLYNFVHVAAIALACFSYVGVEYAKQKGYVHENFPDFPRKEFVTKR